MAIFRGEIRRRGLVCKPIALFALTVAASQAAAAGRTCRRVDFPGEVGAGQQWQTTLGHGWVFRVLPISSSQAGYSGWDLVVDRDPPAGYPDALLLATLPYNSINEREIGTTFGLRSQDAIGWNPRSFHFLSNPAEFREAQQWFRRLTPIGAHANRGRSTPPDTDIMARLLQLQSHASSGQLRVLDARIVPGIVDPQPFAQGWARAVSRTKHEVEQAMPGQAPPQGTLVAMRFTVTLWLPQEWSVPPSLHAVREPCME